MKMADHDYSAGLRDGKIEAIEKMQAEQNDRLNKHDSRISALEKFAWLALGMVLLIQFAPLLTSFLSK